MTDELFTPTRAVVCMNRAEYEAALSELQPGDLVSVQGVVDLTCEAVIRKPLSGGAETQKGSWDD